MELFRRRCRYRRRCLDYTVFITTKPDAVIYRIYNNIMANDPLINTCILHTSQRTEMNRLSACTTKYHTIATIKCGGCLLRSKNCLAFASTWVHLQVLVRSVMLIPLVFCVVFYVLCFMCYVLCVLFVVVLCIVCPMLPVSLDCSFLISPSVLSNVELFTY